MNKKKAIISLKAFLKDEDLINIINTCDLEPESNWRCWSDGFGHKIKFNNKKISYSFKSDDKFIVKDIYFKAHPLDLLKNGKYCLLSLTNSKDYLVLWILGKDNILRCCNLQNGIWKENIPPLSFGIEPVMRLIKNIKVDSHVASEEVYFNGQKKGLFDYLIFTRWPPKINIKEKIKHINTNIYREIIK